MLNWWRTPQGPSWTISGPSNSMLRRRKSPLMNAATGLSFTHRVNTLARIPRDAATFNTLLSALVEVMMY